MCGVAGFCSLTTDTHTQLTHTHIHTQIVTPTTCNLSTLIILKVMFPIPNNCECNACIQKGRMFFYSDTPTYHLPWPHLEVCSYDVFQNPPRGERKGFQNCDKNVDGSNQVWPNTCIQKGLMFIILTHLHIIYLDHTKCQMWCFSNLTF